MPKAEENDSSSVEPWSYHGDRDYLEYGQRHGLLETERSISGLKRICFCYGYIERKLNQCLPCFLVCMYPIVYLLGYYSGFISNHSCEDCS